MNKKLKKVLDIAIWPVLALNIPIIGFMIWLTWGMRFTGWIMVAVWFLAYCITLFVTQRLTKICEDVLKGWNETLEELKAAHMYIGKIKLENDALKALKDDHA